MTEADLVHRWAYRALTARRRFFKALEGDQANAAAALAMIRPAYTTGSIEDPAEQWEQHRKWAIDRLLRFKKVFGRRLPELAKLKPAQE